jgi:hypothetical protein
MTHHIKYRFFLGFLLLIAAPAAAEVEEKQPHDWVWVVRSLQANGINPNSVPWLLINNACMNFNAGSEEFADCQYEKAMNREMHASDRKQCDAESVANYPDSLSEGAQDISINGNHTTIITRPRMNPSEIRTARIGYFRRCMTDMGWISPDNFLMGKRKNISKAD